jgi:hypothetical protein
VPDGSPAATVIVPFTFNVKPVGTVTPVKVTWPGFVPITTGEPFKVSLRTTDGVEPPDAKAIGVSFVASITFDTIIVRVAVAFEQPPVPTTV